MRDAFRRIEVFWEGDQRFYRGTVLCYHAATGLHAITYDDGQKTKENLQVCSYLRPFLPVLLYL